MQGVSKECIALEGPIEFSKNTFKAGKFVLASVESAEEPEHASVLT
jgi:hypothetical protein